MTASNFAASLGRCGRPSRSWVQPLLASMATYFVVVAITFQRAPASSVVALRTPTEIVIASDSYITLTQGGGPSTVRIECKVNRLGGLFFAEAGILFDEDFVVSEIAARALSQNAGRPRDGVETFDSEMKSRLPAVMVRLRRKKSPDYRNRIGKSATEVVFGGISNGVLVMYIRYFMSRRLPNGDVSISVKGVDCPGPQCESGVKFAALGEHRAIDKSLSQDKLPGMRPNLRQDFVITSGWRLRSSQRGSGRPYLSW